MAFIADSLTLSRLLFAAVLVWLGTQGPETLTNAVGVAVLAWTTDQLDGWAARRARTPTYMAPADFAIDTTLYAGTLTYLTLAGFVPLWASLLYAFLAVALAVVYRRKAVAVFCLRFIDLASAIVIFRHSPLLGFLLVGWVAVLGLIYRHRVARRIPLWLAELRDLFGSRVTLPPGGKT